MTGPIGADIFPYLVSGGMTALLLLLGVLIYSLWKANRPGADHYDQLEALLNDDETSTKDTKVTLTSRWCTHWGTVFKSAGISRYNGDDRSAGRDVALALAGVAVAASILARNPLVGVALAGTCAYASSVALKMRHNRKTEELGKQIPGFLFALKANIQSSDTNERAVLKVIDSMPSPLYDDLVVIKRRLLANGSFREALEEMSAKTTSKDLKFLCACMIQASSSGASMVGQIDAIQKVLESRRKVANEINRAVKAVQPAIWLASAIIPGLFLFSYTSDPSSRDFWFVSPYSWLALGVVGVLYVAGLMLTKKQVDKIRDI